MLGVRLRSVEYIVDLLYALSSHHPSVYTDAARWVGDGVQWCVDGLEACSKCMVLTFAWCRTAEFALASDAAFLRTKGRASNPRSRLGSYGDGVRLQYDM